MLASKRLPNEQSCSYWAGDDGYSRPKLYRFLGAQNWQFCIILIGSRIVSLVLFSKWTSIDNRLCSHVIKSTDTCIVEADTDIAGIGVTQLIPMSTLEDVGGLQ